MPKKKGLKHKVGLEHHGIKNAKKILFFPPAALATAEIVTDSAVGDPVTLGGLSWELEAGMLIFKPGI